MCELAAFLLYGLWTHTDDVCDRGRAPVRGLGAQSYEEASRILPIYDTQTKNILDNETN